MEVASANALAGELALRMHAVDAHLSLGDGTTSHRYLCSIPIQAQQGARANVLRCHAACSLTNFCNEAPDCGSSYRTRRASEGRGSSLTFGVLRDA
jgi:hypothetical protein